MQRTRLILIPCTVAAILAGCAVPVGEVDDEGVETTVSALNGLSIRLWEPARDATRIYLDVCFEGGAAAQFSTEVGWVKSALEQTWEAESYVDFRGFGACSGGEELRVKIEDVSDAPHAEGLGTDYGKVHMNFTFKNWNNDGCAGAAVRRGCIQTIAIHEFGHALGFAHEQNRPDFSECADGSTRANKGTDGDTYITGLDNNSIMSYCPEGQWSSWLSAGDKRGVKRMYGAADAPIMSNNRFALRVHGSGFFQFAWLPPFGGHAIFGASTGQFSNISVDRSITVIRRNGDGQVSYGDKLRLRAADGSYLCPGPDPHFLIGVDAVVRTTSSCDWTVNRVTDHAGDLVDVNNPFTLTTPSAFGAGTYTFAVNGEKQLRLLGPLP